MLALYVAHLPWKWLHKIFHRSTDRAVPVYTRTCHVIETSSTANIRSQFINVHGAIKD